jgi:DNA-binding transcriptional LysR family regulator
MAVFVRAVELASFSAAARDLALTPSAVSKTISRIEDRLGVRLLNRTTRKLVLTEEGTSYFSRCRRILADIDTAEIEVSRWREQPRGLLRVNCGLTFGQCQVVPAMPEFFARYPDIRVEFTLTDQLVDVMEEGVDLVLRQGISPDSSLIRRKICSYERVICASPDYLKRHGEPQSPDELKQHNCLYLTTTQAQCRWPFRTRTGRAIVEVHGNCAANNALTILDLALQGTGIARLADFVASTPIRQGRLASILRDTHDVEPVPLYALFPRGRHRAPRLNVMLDFLTEKFSHAPWRDALKARSAQR